MGLPTSSCRTISLKLSRSICSSRTLSRVILMSQPSPKNIIYIYNYIKYWTLMVRMYPCMYPCVHPCMYPCKVYKYVYVFVYKHLQHPQRETEILGFFNSGSEGSLKPGGSCSIFGRSTNLMLLDLRDAMNFGKLYLKTDMFPANIGANLAFVFFHGKKSGYWPQDVFRCFWLYRKILGNLVCKENHAKQDEPTVFLQPSLLVELQIVI